MKKLFLLSFSLFALIAYSQNDATITETVKTLKTYPYSSPNPIPQPDIYYYPYFRFDGFTKTAIDQEWKFIELENDYIKISICPDIGGKIWGAFEKSTGKEFIYYNSVVKFRDIAMRGAWTSGGIELNFGIIGHSPTCATPVDYYTTTNSDGSVSCFIGATDLFTRTRWETEVHLSKDKAYFTTSTKWHNPTPFVQPYYHWMNAAYQSAGDLEFCFPGSHWIGHDGKAHNWPIDDKGRDLSWYKENNFEGSKSHHVVGEISDFYAAYWHDLDFGSVHYAPYGDKLGMKIFLWAFSRSGAIWEDLLTDIDGQYVELQSGRLFNQAVASSTKTPFKHHGFAPYATETFTEYWFPVLRSDGVVKANPLGAFNVEKSENELKLYFCPTQKTNSEIKVYFGDELKASFTINLNTLETWTKTMASSIKNEPVKIVLGDNDLIYSEKPEETNLNRPVESPQDFDWQSVYGLYMDGQQWIYQNKVGQATLSFEACLAKDPHYAPALNQMAFLNFRKADYQTALEYAKKSLSINAYDPEANFIYGIINKQMGKYIDAQDGFSVASLNTSYRVASHLELAKLFILKNEFLTAKKYVDNILVNDPDNPDANLLISLIYRKEGEVDEIETYACKLQSLSPLNHYVRFEHMLLKNNQATKQSFTSMIRNEMPYETYMEMTCWYETLDCYDEAIRLLELSPEHPMVYIKLAYLHHLTGRSSASNYIEKAIQLSPEFVFPFRRENIHSLEWAVEISDNWKLKYYMALIHWHLGNIDNAKELFDSCGNQQEFPYFYVARASLLKDDATHNTDDDLKTAQSVEKLVGKSNKDWRLYIKLIDYYLGKNSTAAAVVLAKEAAANFPENDIVSYNYATCLLAEGEYKSCLEILENTTILPSEGARNGRLTYHQACILEVLAYYQNKRYRSAMQSIDKAKLWPENLGVGKPYGVDERLEDFLYAKCLMGKNQKSKALKLYEQIVTFTEEKAPAYRSADYLYLLALKYTGKESEIQSFLDKWEASATNIAMLRWSQAMINDEIEAAQKIEDQINTKTGGGPPGVPGMLILNLF